MLKRTLIVLGLPFFMVGGIALICIMFIIWFIANPIYYIITGQELDWFK